MTTPNEPLIPYTLSLYAGTRYWWYINPQHQGSYGNAYYRHQLTRGEYQIMVSLTSPDSVRMHVRQGDKPAHVINLIATGEDRETRAGGTAITITETTGTIEFAPIGTISQASVEASVPMVVTIFPYQSYTP